MCLPVRKSEKLGAQLVQGTSARPRCWGSPLGVSAAAQCPQAQSSRDTFVEQWNPLSPKGGAAGACQTHPEGSGVPFLPGRCRLGREGGGMELAGLRNSREESGTGGGAATAACLSKGRKPQDNNELSPRVSRRLPAARHSPELCFPGVSSGGCIRFALTVRYGTQLTFPPPSPGLWGQQEGPLGDLLANSPSAIGLGRVKR